MVTDMLKERLRRGVIEPYYGFYRNLWFLVKKKEANKYRFINNATEINRVTIRDVNLLLNADKFLEDFAGCAIASFIDLFFGCDQIELDEICRDITVFMISLGLIRNTTLFQKITNSVAQFCRIVIKILQDHIPYITRPFLDDIPVKGSKSDYGRKLAAPGIHFYILKYIQALDRVLVDIEKAGVIISGTKFQFGIVNLNIVGYVCDSSGRHPVTAKIIKILKWDEWNVDLTSARAFIEIYVFYRIWVKSFAMIAVPIYTVFRKNGFKWEKKSDKLWSD
jgi:hypothetical protein